MESGLNGESDLLPDITDLNTMSARGYNQELVKALKESNADFVAAIEKIMSKSGKPVSKKTRQAYRKAGSLMMNEKSERLADVIRDLVDKVMAEKHTYRPSDFGGIDPENRDNGQILRPRVMPDETDPSVAIITRAAIDKYFSVVEKLTTELEDTRSALDEVVETANKHRRQIDRMAVSHVKTIREFQSCLGELAEAFELMEQKPETQGSSEKKAETSLTNIRNLALALAKTSYAQLKQIMDHCDEELGPHIQICEEIIINNDDINDNQLKPTEDTRRVNSEEGNFEDKGGPSNTATTSKAKNKSLQKTELIALAKKKATELVQKYKEITATPEERLTLVFQDAPADSIFLDMRNPFEKLINPFRANKDRDAALKSAKEDYNKALNLIFVIESAMKEVSTKRGNLPQPAAQTKQQKEDADLLTAVHKNLRERYITPIQKCLHYYKMFSFYSDQSQLKGKDRFELIVCPYLPSLPREGHLFAQASYLAAKYLYLDPDRCQYQPKVVVHKNEDVLAWKVKIEKMEETNKQNETTEEINNDDKNGEGETLQPEDKEEETKDQVEPPKQRTLRNRNRTPARGAKTPQPAARNYPKRKAETQEKETAVGYQSTESEDEEVVKKKNSRQKRQK